MTWLTSLPATVLVIRGLLLALLAAIGCRLAVRASAFRAISSEGHRDAAPR